MKEHPILFSAPMVRAILAGTKTQTRRPVKCCGEAPPSWATFAQEVTSLLHGRPGWHPIGIFRWSEEQPEKPPFNVLRRWPTDEHGPCAIPCPYGKPGDRLWVRETWGQDEALCEGVQYRADWGQEAQDHAADHSEWRWRPSIHMPRWACRLVLEIVSVRVERVQEISESEALAEGIQKVGNCTPPNYDAKAYQFWNGVSVGHKTAVDSFRALWDPIYAAKGQGWDANPWVWVVEFKKVEAQAILMPKGSSPIETDGKVPS